MQDNRRRALHILMNQLWAVCSTPIVSEIMRAYAYNSSDVVGNIITGDIREDDTYMKLKDVGFDLVVGNPPYNNDMYIDFVLKGHELSRKYDLWITPAKWQAKESKLNDRFRSKIVPNIEKVVFYPETREIFDVTLRGGISVFITCSSPVPRHEIICKCKRQPLFNESCFASELDSLYPCYSYMRAKFISDAYMDQVVSLKRNVFCAEQEYGSASGDVVVRQGSKVTGYLNSENDERLWNQIYLGKYKVCLAIMSGASEIDESGRVLGLNEIHKLLPMEVPKGSYPVLFMSDKEAEVDSFISYMKTKFFRFLYFIGTTGSTVSANFFRFIPKPECFDHIFTDEELYNRYKLSEYEVGIIESIIRERE